MNGREATPLSNCLDTVIVIKQYIKEALYFLLVVLKEIEKNNKTIFTESGRLGVGGTTLENLIWN